MKVIYFDTETTGLSRAEICQLSYIIDNGIEVYGKNFFFKVKEMNPLAEAVHGFSLEMLEELSNGATFDDYIDEIEKEFSDSDLIVAHNASFDITMMKAEFERRGKHFNPKSYLCTMRFLAPHMKIIKRSGSGYKYPSLTEIVASFVPDISMIDDYTEELYGIRGRFHDARYDTVSLYLAVYGARKEIEILKEKVCASI